MDLERGPGGLLVADGGRTGDNDRLFLFFSPNCCIRFIAIVVVIALRLQSLVRHGKSVHRVCLLRRGRDVRLRKVTAALQSASLFLPRPLAGWNRLHIKVHATVPMTTTRRSLVLSALLLSNVASFVPGRLRCIPTTTLRATTEEAAKLLEQAARLRAESAALEAELGLEPAAPTSPPDAVPTPISDPVPAPPSFRIMDDPDPRVPLAGNCLEVTLDLGRQKGSWMPPAWASSGMRAEFVLPRVYLRSQTCDGDPFLKGTAARQLIDPTQEEDQDQLVQAMTRPTFGANTDLKPFWPGFCLGLSRGAWSFEKISKEEGRLRMCIDLPDGIAVDDLTLPKGERLFCAIPVFPGPTLSSRAGIVSVRRNVLWRTEYRIVGTWKAKITPL